MCVSKNITEGNIYKSLILYAIPLILSSLLNNIYSTVDALIAGKFIGEYSLGAISATGSFETLFRSLFIGFAGGLSIYVAHLFGKGDFSNLKRDVINVAAFVSALSITISAFAIAFRNPIMDYLKVDPILRADAEMYFCINTSVYVFSFLNLMLVQVMHALGVTSFSFYISLGSALLNIIGNLLTVLVFDMGVAGIALSTAVSIVAATVFYVIIIHRVFVELSDERIPFRFEFSSIVRSFGYTFPAAVQQLAFHCVGFLIAPMINGLGAAATSGYNVSTRLYNLCTITIWQMTSAMNCYTAQCVGGGCYHKIPRGLRVGFLMNSLMLLPFVLVSVLFSGPIVSVFFPSGYVGEAYGYAIRYATVFMPFVYVQLVDHVMHAYMRSLGKVNVVLGITFFGSAVRVAATALLVPLISMDGVYLGQVISWAADSVVSVIIYVFLYRTEEQIRRAVRRVHSEKTQNARRLKAGFLHKDASKLSHVGK